MVRLKKVYLAGPEVFLPDAIDIATRKKRLCLEYGFEGSRSIASWRKDWNRLRQPMEFIGPT